MVLNASVEWPASPAAEAIPAVGHQNGASPTNPRPVSDYSPDDVARERGTSVTRSGDEARTTAGLITAGGRVLSANTARPRAACLQFRG